MAPLRCKAEEPSERCENHMDSINMPCRNCKTNPVDASIKQEMWESLYYLLQRNSDNTRYLKLDVYDHLCKKCNFNGNRVLHILMAAIFLGTTILIFLFLHTSNPNEGLRIQIVYFFAGMMGGVCLMLISLFIWILISGKIDIVESIAKGTLVAVEPDKELIRELKALKWKIGGKPKGGKKLINQDCSDNEIEELRKKTINDAIAIVARHGLMPTICEKDGARTTWHLGEEVSKDMSIECDETDGIKVDESELNSKEYAGCLAISLAGIAIIVFVGWLVFPVVHTLFMATVATLPYVPYLIIITIIFLIHFLPSYIAIIKRHRHKWPIVAVNLFLGWTLLAWVGALVWALLPADTTTNSIPHGPKYSK